MQRVLWGKLKSSRRELPEKDTRDRLKWEKEQLE
jgi:hypothetical protein